MLPHLDAAYNLARWLTGDGHHAQDVAQESYLRALTFFEGFHGEDGRAWLLAIVRNTCYDWLKKNRRYQAGQGDAALEQAIAEGPDPEEEQLQQADRRAVQQGLEQLAEEYREVLVLREMEGMSYKQIAQVTETPIGTVMSRLARARKRLGQILAAAERKGV